MPHDNPFLWVALDGWLLPNSHITPELLDNLQMIPGNWGWKINLDTMLANGCAEVLSCLPDCGTKAERPRFGDGKTHNGRRTMIRTLDVAHAAGFTHWNFHLTQSDGLEEVVQHARTLGMTTLGLTQLSHGGVSTSQVKKLVGTAESCGFDEVILPAFVASKIKTNLSILGTGFRPKGPDEHQPHALHPREACGLVSSVAIGSPIIAASNPVAALQLHLDWLSGNK